MTHKDKILSILSDGEFHNATELEQRVGWRFGARIFDLKQENYLFEKRRGKNGLDDWKLIEIPDKAREEVYGVLESEIEKKVKQEKLFEIPYRY